MILTRSHEEHVAAKKQQDHGVDHNEQPSHVCAGSGRCSRAETRTCYAWRAAKFQRCMLTRRKPVVNAQKLDRDRQWSDIHSVCVTEVGFTNIPRPVDRGFESTRPLADESGELPTSPRPRVHRRAGGGDAIQHRGQRLQLPSRRPDACLLTHAPQSCHQRGVSAPQPPDSQWEEGYRFPDQAHVQIAVIHHPRVLGRGQVISSSRPPGPEIPAHPLLAELH